MEFIDISEDLREDYNRVVGHPLQSYEWGEFRIATGVKVIRRGVKKNGKLVDGFSLTIHRVPRTKFTIGYFPKGKQPTKEIIKELTQIGKEENCIFIQLEPNLNKIHDSGFKIQELGLRPSFHPLFTKYTFILDLTKSEEDLLKNMHQKTRYNIRVAQKNGVWVEQDSSREAFEEYFKLVDETTRRQNFYAHTKRYHELQWELFGGKEKDTGELNNRLTYHLFQAKYKDESGATHTLVSWVLFTFHDWLYYPYGASSSMFRNVMASNLIMWEAIRFGKEHGLKHFDMWGALGPEPDSKDPWFGFHRFKQGYGAEHTEFVGSFDLVINPTMYQLYKVADKARWAYLKLRKR